MTKPPGRTEDDDFVLVDSIERPGLRSWWVRGPLLAILFMGSVGARIYHWVWLPHLTEAQFFALFWPVYGVAFGACVLFMLNEVLPGNSILSAYLHRSRMRWRLGRLKEAWQIAGSWPHEWKTPFALFVRSVEAKIPGFHQIRITRHESGRVDMEVKHHRPPPGVEPDFTLRVKFGRHGMIMITSPDVPGHRVAVVHGPTALGDAWRVLAELAEQGDPAAKAVLAKRPVNPLH